MGPSLVLSRARLCCRIAAVALLVAGFGSTRTAEGQTVYRWTDENGVQHFSDSAPPKGLKFEGQRLPPAAPAREAKKAVAKPAPGKSAATPPKEAGGAAHVVLEEKHVEENGPSAREFRGTVKNTGGATARGVYVSIRVNDMDQGDECIRDKVDVSPSELPPGETGTFEVWFDNPCFLGNAGVELVPEWSAKD